MGMRVGWFRSAVGLKVSFGKPIGADDVDDEDAFRYFAIEGDMAHVKEAAKAGAEFLAFVSHGRHARKENENPVPVEKIGIGLGLAEMQTGIFVDAREYGVRGSGQAIGSHAASPSFPAGYQECAGR